MYLHHYGLQRMPFSIAPDPELLFRGAAHSEALAHLHYALTSLGGLICLTGEVGLGKTTLCRTFMAELPEKVRVAYIFNPQLSANELLATICQELQIPISDLHSLKSLTDDLYHGLLQLYQQGEKVICLIDEAQAMPEVLLEQVRLLTNLETDKEKLMTLILVGQPELREILKQHHLRQFNQRITARYHLSELSLIDCQAYLKHRLMVAGSDKVLFDAKAVEILWRISGGVPRIINTIADRALLAGFALGRYDLDSAIIKQAAKEVLGEDASLVKNIDSSASENTRPWLFWVYPWAVFSLLALVVYFYIVMNDSQNTADNSYDVAALSFDQFKLGGSPDVQVADELGRTGDEVAQLAEQYSVQGDSCQQLMKLQWQCLTIDWPLSVLKKLKRPVLLFTKQQEWLLMRDLTAEQYAGKAMLLWQPPQGFSQAIHPLQSNQVVAWVRQQLPNEDLSQWQVIGNKGAGQLLSFYDPLLAEQVKLFQQRHQMSADKIIGPQTLLMMQAMSFKEEG